MSEYKFVVLRGTLVSVSDPNELAEVKSKFVEESQKKLSTNFLHAHGFTFDQGWGVLTETNSLVLMKLIDIEEQIGLKSP